MKLRIKIISVALSFIVLTCAFFTVTMVAYAQAAKSRTIIILPGLFASGLYNTANNEEVWDPFYDSDLSFSDIMDESGALTLDFLGELMQKDSLPEHINRLLENDSYGTEDSLFNLIAMNEDGSAAVETVQRVPWDTDNRLKYGVVNSHKDMVIFLSSQYGDDFFVQVFNYDFRKDIRYNAQILEEYINEQKYDEVILVAHSNGGMVAANYLARSQENRDKVKKLISYNVPYLGSLTALTMLEDLDSMIEGISSSLPSFLATMIGNVFDRQFKKIINMWAVYQLLPSYELLSQEYLGEKQKIYIDDELQVFENAEQLWEFYCSRPWAKMSNGELRPPMQEWLDFKKSMYVEVNGELVHSTTLVDTTYFNGSDIDAVMSIEFTLNQEENRLETTNRIMTKNSDGTVLTVSAIAGCTDSSNIKFFQGYNHYGVVVNYLDIASKLTKESIDEYLLGAKTPLEKAFGNKNTI